jgi:hypothetical protein
MLAMTVSKKDTMIQMQKRGFLLIALLISVVSQAQRTPAISTADSQAIIGVWKQFTAAIDAGANENIRALSLPVVQCRQCTSSPAEDYFVPIDSFVRWSAKIPKHSTLWRSMTTANPEPYQTITPDYTPPNLKGMQEKDLVLYQLAFTSIYPSNLEPRNEGAQMLFQFVKVNNKFLFYGIFPIP